MKELILKIAKNLELNIITETEAKNLLSDLLNNTLNNKEFFCDYCKEDNIHNILEFKKLKECTGCGLLTNYNQQ